MSEHINSVESEVSPAEIGAPQIAPETQSAVETAAPTQIAVQDCGTNAVADATNMSASYVYAIGRLRPAFPSASIEQEFYQAVTRPAQSNGAGQVPDDALVYSILSLGQNLYIAREICWVLQIDGADQVGFVDAYVVLPRTYVELYNMVLTLEPISGQKRYDVIIGPRGPIATPDMCGGLQLPTVLCNQIYSFTFEQFVQQMLNALNPPSNISRDVISSMFKEMLNVADNAGETDEHRAINYITLRYPQVYRMAGDMLNVNGGAVRPGESYTFTGIEAKPASVQGVRKIVDVIFRYRSRSTGEIVHSFCGVDVTGQFPFLVRPMSRYYPHP